jgi:hypothetical protein
MEASSVLFCFIPSESNHQVEDRCSLRCGVPYLVLVFHREWTEIKGNQETGGQTMAIAVICRAKAQSLSATSPEFAGLLADNTSGNRLSVVRHRLN